MTDEPSVYLGNLGRCPALISLEIRGSFGDARASREVATLFSKTLQENPNLPYVVTPGEAGALAIALYGAECKKVSDDSLPFVAAALGIQHAVGIPSSDEESAKNMYRIARAMKWDAKAVQDLANKTCDGVFWSEDGLRDRGSHCLATRGAERFLEKSDADFLLTDGWGQIFPSPGDLGLFLRGLLTSYSLTNERFSSLVARRQLEREVELRPPSEGAFERGSACDWALSTFSGVFYRGNNAAITGDPGEDCMCILVKGSVKVSSYVVSRRPAQRNYPVAWKVLASRDGRNWFEIDRRQNNTSIQNEETVVIQLPGRTCPVKAIRFVQKQASDGGNQLSLRYFDVFGLFKENATLNVEES